MTMQAMWVHGNSASIQLNGFGRGPGEDINGLSWTAVEGLRLGWGVQYRCQDNSGYWFHFAIPTPVILNGVHAHLRRVMVLFTADPGVTLGSVHVWDGPSRVFAQDALAIGGANLGLIPGRNSFDIPDRSVNWGIGISMLFNFADPGSVTLHTAGVDLEA